MNVSLWLNSSSSSVLRSARPAFARRGQGLVEFALVLPLLLLFVFGILEVGRLLAIYSGASSATRQASRYGSVGGENAAGTTFYLDCNGMRTAAKSTAFLQTLADTDIQISYDTGFITDTVGVCGSDNVPRFVSDGTPMTASNSDALLNGGRVVISITTTYRPVTPIVPIPSLPMTFVAARSIFTSISGPTPVPPAPPDLVLNVTTTPSLVAPNGLLTYTLVVSNTGPSTVTSVVLSDTFPATYQSHTSTGWGSCTLAGNTITCNAPVMAPGATARLTLVVRAPASGTLVNYATVTSSTGDATPENNSETTQTLVLSAADLTLGLTDQPDPTTPSSPVTYTLWVTNTGSITASSVRVTDTLPSGATFVSALGSGWSCSQSLGTVVCTRASLAVGAAPAITIRITAPSGDGTLTNSAVVGSTTLDPDLSNNSASTTTTLVSTADLAVTLTDAPDPAGLNDTITYVLRVTNNGPSPVTSVTLTDTLPAGVTFISASGSGWTCNQASGVVTCTLPSLGVGAAPDVTVVVQAPNSSTTLTNNVSVTSAVTDSNPANNSASAQTTILACHPNVVSADYSRLLASASQVQADGQDVSQVTLTLKDDCGSLLANQPVSLVSSRGAEDTITPASGATNANGQFIFSVTSSKTSPYAGGLFTSSVFTATSGATTISQTANVAFVCVTGVPAPFSGTQDIQYSFTNNTGINRRIVEGTLTWPSGSGRKLNSISFGPDQIWSGNGNHSPLTITSGWTSGSRTLDASLSKTLKLTFNYALTGTGTYTLVTKWDNGSGGSVCAAPAIQITR